MSEGKSTKYFRLILIFSFLLLTFSFSPPHKFYTSIASIEYNEKHKSAEIIMNVFVDDLETSLSVFHKTKIRIDENTCKDKKLETQVSQYLSDHFFVLKGKKTFQNKFIGIEYNKKDLVTIYIEIEGLKTLNGLEIEDTMLTKEFEEIRAIAISFYLILRCHGY